MQKFNAFYEASRAVLAAGFLVLASLHAQTIIDEWGTANCRHRPQLKPAKMEAKGDRALVMDFTTQTCTASAARVARISVPKIAKLVSRRTAQGRDW